MFQIYLSEKTRKILYFLFNGVAIACLLLIILVPPCVTQVAWEKSIYDYAEQLAIVIMVIVPFISGYAFFLMAIIVREYTKEDALRQLEQQLYHGKISFDEYGKMLKHIEHYDLEKRKMKAELEKEKFQIKQETKAEVEKALKELKSEKEQEKLIY